MNPRGTSLLGHALLGLLAQKPSSGYDIRRIFTQTPMGTFSDSPGAIYPALQRLENDGLIRGEIQDRSGLRRRKLFRLTAAGTSTFKHWLSRQITPEDIVHRVDELMLRFSFMEKGLGEAAVIRFLKALHEELSVHIPQLRKYLGCHQADMPRSGRLALESGIQGYETLLRWSNYALATYKRKDKGGKEP